nr:hypothetical protein [Mucilaginibacter sp. SP1R1]
MMKPLFVIYLYHHKTCHAELVSLLSGKKITFAHVAYLSVVTQISTQRGSLSATP